MTLIPNKFYVASVDTIHSLINASEDECDDCEAYGDDNEYIESCPSHQAMWNMLQWFRMEDR